jgi:hypothetical protein
MDKKKSIINIRDLGLSVASRHYELFIGFLFLDFFTFRKNLFEKVFQDIGEQPIP